MTDTTLLNAIMAHYIPNRIEAMEQLEDFEIYHGTAEDYARDFLEATTDTEQWVKAHIDYSTIAAALESDGEFKRLSGNRLLVNNR